MTGWGQEGPLAQRAGHDIAYIALTGTLGMIGTPGEPPAVPANLVGDYAGGSLYLVVGVLAALHHARATGAGQVVDAAIVDGTAHLAAMIHGMLAAGGWQDRRGANLLDGGCPYYGTYETADGAVHGGGRAGAAVLRRVRASCSASRTQAPARKDLSRWGELREAVAARFKTRTRDEWTAVFEGSDACVAPVLSLREAPAHPHLAARGTFTDHGGITQPAPAPRFSAHPHLRPQRPRPAGRRHRGRGPRLGRTGPPEGQPGRMKRQIFAPEHDAFRETVRTFLAKEVLPHYEQWEKDGIVSRDAWRAAGKQGLLGFAVPGGVRGRRQRRLPLQRRTRRGVHARGSRRARARAAQRHHRAVSDGPGHRGAEAALAARVLRRLADHGDRHDRTRRRIRPPGHHDARRGPGRPLAAQRLQDLHLERDPRRPGDRRGEDDSRRRRQGAVPARRRARHGGLRARAQPRQDRPEGPGHRRVVLPRRTRAQGEPARRARTAPSST